MPRRRRRRRKPSPPPDYNYGMLFDDEKPEEVTNPIITLKNIGANMGKGEFQADMEVDTYKLTVNPHDKNELEYYVMLDMVSRILEPAVDLVLLTQRFKADCTLRFPCATAKANFLQVVRPLCTDLIKTAAPKKKHGEGPSSAAN